MINLILLLSADQDIQTAFNRYEEIQSGRGEVFLNHLDVALALLKTHPEIAPVFQGPYRRLLLKDFPYGIFYQVQPTRIVVTAIMDLRQDPASIQRRLSL
jgi:hypothetical protein